MTPDEFAALKPGDYAPPRPGDIRSPCPAINALSNHGYLPRDGRNVRYTHFNEGLKQYGLSDFLRWFLSYPIMLEHQPANTPNTASWWSIITNPAAYALRSAGMRNVGQKDAENVPCLNLDQLALHNAVEHDVSLTRRDIAQGDNITPQPDLIADLLAASSNGKTITMDDFIQLRRKRYDQQKADNPKLDFQAQQAKVACSEVAMILKVFGDGKEVQLDYMKALFQEARLPKNEGWLKRTWWTLGIVEMRSLATKIQGILGPPEAKTTPVVEVGH